MAKIEHKDDGKEGIFHIYDDSERAGELSYTWAGKDKIIVDHTLVFDRHKSKGFAKELVWEAVAFARKEKIKILPLCPFAKAMFDKHSELDDVRF